jgi:hypothetical protein
MSFCLPFAIALASIGARRCLAGKDNLRTARDRHVTAVTATRLVSHEPFRRDQLARNGVGCDTAHPC